jgi:hypothetical protein
MKKKRLLTLMALTVMALGAWGQAGGISTTGYAICDSKWKQLCILPASAEESDGTSVRFFNCRADLIGSGKFKILNPTANMSKSASTTIYLGGTDTKESWPTFGATSGSAGVKKAILNYDPENFTITFKDTDVFELKVPSVGATTLCLPLNATIPTGVKAYKLTYSEDKLHATPIEGETISANTPVLINAPQGKYSFTLSGDYNYNIDNNGLSGSSQIQWFVDIPAAADNLLIGVYQPHFVPNGSWVLQVGDNGLGFYQVNVNNYAINAFRCYVTLPDVGARSLSIVFDDSETTGIADVKGKKEDVRGDIFNLSGQRVGKDYKGVVIKNGRKMIQK